MFLILLDKISKLFRHQCYPGSPFGIHNQLKYIDTDLGTEYLCKRCGRQGPDEEWTKSEINNSSKYS